MFVFFQNVSSVEKALERFTKPEHLQNDNAYKCTKCKKKGQATKRFSIHRPPNVVTIQLKRFEFNRYSGKITKHIEFPEFLNLRPYTSDPSGASLMYRLNAVLVHSGSSCNAGHYYSYVRNSNNSWFRMDDERVSSAGLQNVLNQNAYILFYIKRTAESKPVSNGCATAVVKESTASIRTSTPVPSISSKITCFSIKPADILPRPFADPSSSSVNRNSLLAPKATPPQTKGPKLIPEPEKKKPATSNGNHMPPVNGGGSNHVNKSLLTNLVPYSSDSSDDEEVIKHKGATNGTATVQNIRTLKSERESEAALTSVTSKTTHNRPQQTNGMKNSPNSSFDPDKVGDQTLQSFGSKGMLPISL